MAGHKKKVVVLLAALGFFGGLLAVSGSRSTGPSSTAEPPRLQGGSIFSEESDFGKSAEDFGTGRLLFRTMISVLLVVALGVAAIYLSKKFGSKLSNVPGREIQVLETAHLGPRKMVHLIKIGDRRLLVGSTNENISMLADVTGAGINPAADPQETEAFYRAESPVR
ncbi:MAG: flagellar biosynthetic protein FliO [Planctomycetota bacterium]